MRSRTPTAGRRGAGFTLVELLVSLSVSVGILVAMLALFTSNVKLARAQINVTEMQQSMRVAQHELVRMVRMAGRGGLPRGGLPLGQALALTKNVAQGTTIGDTGTPRVLADTDILTLRGVFNTPYYQVNPAGGNFALDDPGNPTSGWVRLQNPNPSTGIAQDLTGLAAGLEATTPIAEPLLIVSALNDETLAVVEVIPGGSTVERKGDEVTAITLAFDIKAEYLPLSTGGVYPPSLTNVAFVGVLEEYRYYVREAYEITTSELTPRLARARFFPGTDEPYAGNATNLAVDLADNILDFQVALGIDVDDNSVVDDQPPLTPESDEWLYNHSADDDTQARWNTVPGSIPNRVPDLSYVRLSTLARTDRPDLKYVSPPIDQIEDHVLGEPTIPASQAELERRSYRRWQLQTVVDLRNI